MGQNFTDFAFTPSVKKAQEDYGSRKNYERMEGDPDRFLLTTKEKDFIAGLDFFFMATTGENGWPYVQYRGGPVGFLRVLDDRTLGFADFRGNRQLISVGNINSGGKASLILLNFPLRARLKVWATASVQEATDDPELAVRLSDPGYKANVERLVTLRIEAYDWNCPQHIKPRYTEEQISADISRFIAAADESCENCP